MTPIIPTGRPRFMGPAQAENSTGFQANRKGQAFGAALSGFADRMRDKTPGRDRNAPDLEAHRPMGVNCFDHNWLYGAEMAQFRLIRHLT